MDKSKEKGFTEKGQGCLDKKEVPAEWLLIGLAGKVGYSAMFEAPVERANITELQSLTLSFESAIEANTRLMNLGHEPELRRLVNTLLEKRDYEALRSLLVLNKHLKKI